MSANGHDATVNGATLTADRFGNPNTAYHYTGGQYTDIPLDCSSLKPLTYSLWINGSVAEFAGHNGAFQQQAGESVTRGDRRRRELQARSSSPPLA